ncbi:MAG: hypothetical protein ABEJ93_01300 [Candidatus Nanohalobium sp.]
MKHGCGEIPVVVVSRGMGEGMVSQPLISGSISAPVLPVVCEPVHAHTGNSANTLYQTNRGKLGEKITEKKNFVDYNQIGKEKKGLSFYLWKADSLHRKQG